MVLALCTRWRYLSLALTQFGGALFDADFQLLAGLAQFRLPPCVRSVISSTCPTVRRLPEAVRKMVVLISTRRLLLVRPDDIELIARGDVLTHLAAHIVFRHDFGALFIQEIPEIMPDDLVVGVHQHLADHIVGVSDAECLIDGEDAGVGVFHDGAEHLLRFLPLVVLFLALGNIMDDAENDEICLR